MFAYSLGFAIGFGSGGALIWFYKDKIIEMVQGGEALVKSLEAKIAALKAK